MENGTDAHILDLQRKCQFWVGARSVPRAVLKLSGQRRPHIPLQSPQEPLETKAQRRFFVGLPKTGRW